MAQIYSIVYQPKDQKYDERLDYFIRVPLEEAMLIAAHGIEGDDKAGRNRNRQLNLLSHEWLTALKPQGYKIEPGNFGEQLIVKDLDVTSLNTGDRLQLGDEALIEVTKPRTGCSRLEAAQGMPLDETIRPTIGVMAKVIMGGTIRVGDAVKVLQPVE